jgi:hypothetical protein
MPERAGGGVDVKDSTLREDSAMKITTAAARVFPSITISELCCVVDAD